jgi:hypothetical protein
MSRVTLQNWEDVRQAVPWYQQKFDMVLRQGNVFGRATDGWSPLPEDRFADINPRASQNQGEATIFYDWEQVEAHDWTLTDTEEAKKHWFLFTHPETNLPHIVEFYAFGLVGGPS